MLKTEIFRDENAIASDLSLRRLGLLVQLLRVNRESDNLTGQLAIEHESLMASCPEKP